MTFTAETFLADIPLEIAVAAYRGTSFSPEQRGESARQDYARTLAADYADLVQLATTPEQIAMLNEEFARYREGYKKRALAYLRSHANCVSWMIAGPSNFPVRQMQKRNQWADNKATEMVEFRERALDAIRKKFRPADLRPIMAGDADAVERLQAKIDEAEALQVKMKKANAIIRKNLKASPEEKVAALVAAGFSEDAAREILTPDCFGCIGFASYQLTNNNNNIKRMKARLAQIQRNQAQPTVAVETETGVRVEDCPAENRIRLFFPGKPDAETRDMLKRNGFRWAPSLGCWQAFRNWKAMETVKQFTQSEAA